MSRRFLLQATAEEGSPYPMPPAMLVFAHPDDEVVALGARLGRFRSACFVLVTDGAPKNEEDSRLHGFASLDDYRRARELEVSRALEKAGLKNVHRERLEIPDQEASFRLAWLARRLEGLMLEQMPEAVFTHPYEGGHPDHDACAFSVHKAAAMMKARGGAAPAILEGAFYHATAEGSQAGTLPDDGAETEPAEYPLSLEERQRKQALLDCFTTQRQTLSGFPLEYECFRIAPSYNFQQLPNQGRILYDRFPWGMTSQRFLNLARAGEEELVQCL